jgi:methionine biosynthesis protein MetW
MSANSPPPPAAPTDPNIRAAHDWIVGITPHGARVLDIGCGDGHLLALLADRRSAIAAGIELNRDEVMSAIMRGLSVHHGNADEGLDHYADSSHDLVILSLTIQELGRPLEVLRECLRVGKRIVVVFPNFANWRARLHLGLYGHAPDIPSLPYTWYETPNRHYLSVADWDAFVVTQGWRVVERAFVAKGRRVWWAPNLRAELAMYLIEPAQP